MGMRRRQHQTEALHTPSTALSTAQPTVPPDVKTQEVQSIPVNPSKF